MINIIFEAHATSLDNEAEKASGHYDVALSQLGVQQAHDLGARYKDKELDAIFCSDTQRAYNTAEIGFGKSGIPIIKDVRLRECDYGDYTRRSTCVVKPEKLKRITEPFPNGESYEQTTQRMKEFLIDLIKKYDHKTVLIIGHRATQYGLEHWINGRSLTEIIRSPWKWQPGWQYKLKSLQ